MMQVERGVDGGVREFSEGGGLHNRLFWRPLGSFLYGAWLIQSSPRPPALQLTGEKQ